MRALSKRLEKLEAKANPTKERCLSVVIADVGETMEEALARDGFTAEDNVYVLCFVAPGGVGSETGDIEKRIEALEHPGK